MLLERVDFALPWQEIDKPGLLQERIGCPYYHSDDDGDDDDKKAACASSSTARNHASLLVVFQLFLQ
jgi:hypothetical protein